MRNHLNLTWEEIKVFEPKFPLNKLEHDDIEVIA
jgi:hypothetical protein